jgi:hypothetical protein
MEPSTNIPVHKSDIKIKTLGMEGISKHFHLSPQYYIIPRHVRNPQVYDVFSSLAGNDKSVSNTVHAKELYCHQ